MNFGTPELLIVLLIILLVFGGTQLPKLARSLGRAQKEFKDGLTTGAPADDEVAEKAAEKAVERASDNKKNQTS